MSDHFKEGEALDKPGLFQLVSDEAFRDGVLEPVEERILQVVARFLKLEAGTAKEIARVSKRKFQEGKLGDAGRLDPTRLYGNVLDMVASDGEVDELEEQMLQGLRQLLKIPDSAHARMLGQRLGAVQEDEGPEIPAVLREERNAFRLRIGEGREQIQEEEDGRWARIGGAARDGVIQVFSRLLASMPPGPLEPMDEALRQLEAGIEHENCTSADMAAVMRLAQISRILHRTETGIGAVLWMGDERYPRVMGSLRKVFQAAASRPGDGVLEEALDLALIGLWRDLIHLTRRRQREAIEALAPALVAACRAGANLAARRLGDAVLPAVLESLEVHDEGCLPAVKQLRDQLAGLDPAGADLVPTTSPAAPRVSMDLELLRRETAWMRPAAAAARTLDRAPLDDFFDSCRAKVEQDGMPWEAFKTGFFAAGVVPRSSHLDRPLLVLVTAGAGPDGREAFKTRRLELRAKRGENRELVFAVDVGPEGNTRPLLPPIDPETADRFEVALDASKGRYLVLLVDRALQPLRVYEHVGDLDVSGAWDQAIEFLGESDRHAVPILHDLLERRPWLAMGHVHLGLIAKRADDKAGARKHFEAALESQPDEPVALTRLGVLAKQTMEMERAVELLTRSLAIDPTQPDAYGTLASIHLSLAQDEPEHMGHWIQVTAGMHAFLGAGPDLQGLKQALVGAGLPESLFRHLGQMPVDPVCYG